MHVLGVSKHVLGEQLWGAAWNNFGQLYGPWGTVLWSSFGEQPWGTAFESGV